MTRASQARRIASAAMYGGGGLVGVGATMAGVLFAELKLARRAIGDAVDDPHDPTGTYRADGVAEDAPPVRLILVGDSTAAGYGVEFADQTPAAVIARGVSERIGRPVHSTTVAEVGAQSSALEGQLDRVLGGTGERPDVAVVMIGANDVTHGVRPAESVRHLAGAVRRLRDADIAVVVGTCPDLGTVRPIRHPLRLVARRWGRSLAAAQTIVVVEEGGRSVSLGDLLGPEFDRAPNEYFGPDRFHPSAAGYAAASYALLPSVCAALGVETEGDDESGGGPPSAGSVMPISEAAIEAVDSAGTEITSTQVAGRSRGPLGLWVVLRKLPGVPHGNERADATPQDADASADR